MSDQQYELFRYYHRDGTSKDWAIRVNSGGTVTKRWGKTGTRLTSKEFSMTSWEAQKEIQAKVGKGYRSLGLVFIDIDGNISNVPSIPSVETADAPRIYWRIRIPSYMTDSPDLASLRGYAIGCANVIYNAYPACLWVGSAVKDQGAFVKNDAGSFLKKDGVASLLLLMALKRRAPEGLIISMSHDDGIEISSTLKLETEALSFFDTDLESVRPIAEKFGLLAKRIDLSMVAPELEDLYF